MIFFLVLTVASQLYGQEGEQLLLYGNMDEWVDREIKESSIIGGHVKHVYEIAPTQTIKGAIPYYNLGNSPWATSNVMAKVVGIVKTNTSVFPEKRGDGFCARLETRIEKVKVFGLINIKVLAAGSIFTGSMNEPVKGTEDPQKILQTGIPFTNKPKAVVFDYKVKLSESDHRIKSTGFSKRKDVEGKDFPMVVAFLQERWEDEKGNIYAKRVGTLVHLFKAGTNEWVNDARYEILYGDISSSFDYDPHTMRLNVTDNYTINSKGDNVLVQEVGWADASAQPTHLFLQFSSSHGGAYIGSPGNTFWVDNVRMDY